MLNHVPFLSRMWRFVLLYRMQRNHAEQTVPFVSQPEWTGCACQPMANGDGVNLSTVQYYHSDVVYLQPSRKEGAATQKQRNAKTEFGHSDAAVAKSRSQASKHPRCRLDASESGSSKQVNIVKD